MKIDFNYVELTYIRRALMGMIDVLLDSPYEELYTITADKPEDSKLVEFADKEEAHFAIGDVLDELNDANTAISILYDIDPEVGVIYQKRFETSDKFFKYASKVFGKVWVTEWDKDDFDEV